MKVFITILLIMLMFTANITAQVDPLYAQYLNNPLLINPAYTGMNKYLNVMAGFRKQWAGFDGSPTTVYATGHTSLIDNKMGVGLIISQDKIGENTNTLVQGTYAYKVSLSESQVLSLGLQAGIMNFQTDNGELNPADPTDPLFTGVQNTTSPTFGAGVIFKTDKAFVGLSVPRLLKATTDYETSTGTEEVNLYTQHFYGFASYLFLITQRLRLKPGILLRGVSGSPLAVDINAQINIDERFAAGAFTRNFNTYGLLAQMKVNQFRFGYVFELPTNQSVGTNFTTHELSVGMNIAIFSFHDTLEFADY